MRSRLFIFLHILFFVIAGVELAGRLLDNIQLEYWVKPLIMPWMAGYFLLYSRKKTYRWPILLAFFFSWAGDLFLMFSGGYQSEMYFYAGVGGFFVAQCFYILVFARRSEFGGKGQYARQWLWILPFIFYLAIMLVILLPGMEGVMRVIISIYAISLLGMSALALNRKYRVSLASFRWVFIGSVFFVLSDSMIALNKFSSPIALAGFWIMLTYMAAQYMITRGLAMEK